jgi:hypothetical protein
MSFENPKNEKKNGKKHEPTAQEIAKNHGISADEIYFIVPIKDQNGNVIAQENFMQWKFIPWKARDIHGNEIELKLPIEDCIEATKKYGFEIHEGRMKLLEAIEKLKDEEEK